MTNTSILNTNILSVDGARLGTGGGGGGSSNSSVLARPGCAA
jgi:hypothetical protein